MTFCDNSPARHRLLRLAISVSLVVATVGSAAAQQTAAAIIGQVTDETGAVMPGVTVTATSAALQAAEMVAVTDARGEYRLTPLPIGTYTRWPTPSPDSRHSGERMSG